MRIQAERTAVFVPLVLLLATLASGQYRAGVQGIVTDATKGVIPGATVTVVSKETNFSRTGITSGSGVYSITGLAPGRYRITVEMGGFAPKTLDDVVISAEETQSLDVQLAVGELIETVTVSADVIPVVENKPATVSGTVTTRQVESLPYYGRDPFNLVQLTPGAFGDGARAAGGGSRNLPGNAGPGGSGSSNIFQTENQVQVVANGTRNTSNTFLIDGVAVNSLNWGGATVVTPNSESVKEVRIESSSYNAENARAGGAQVMVVSKNGTNEWHGSAFIRAARPGLNAYQKWNGPTANRQRVSDRFNQFGGSVGGPILRDKLFFFISYESLRQKATSAGSGWYETQQFIDKVKATKPGSIAARISGFPGEGASYSSISQTADCANANITPCTNMLDSAGKLIGLDIGSPLNLPLGTPDPSWVSGKAVGFGGGLDGSPDIMFVNTLNPNKQTAKQYNARVDFQATQNDLVAFSMFQTPVETESFNGPARSANFWINDRLNHAETLLWNHTFSPRFINETRVSVSRWSWDEVESNPQEPWGLPTISIDSLRNAKMNNFGAPGPGIFAQTTYNFRDTASWVHGNHLTKFGADIYWEQNNSKRAGGARPTYYFRNLWDFANDAPYQESGTFDPRTGVPSAVAKYLRSGIWGFFIQDDWRVRPNLTLNLGLRWEYFDPLSEKYDELSNAVFGSGDRILSDLKMKLGGDLFKANKNDWGPQLGFAWTPLGANSDFVVRGGFGIGFTRTEGAILADSAGNAPYVSSATLQNEKVLYAVPQDVKQFYGWPANPATVLQIDPNTNLPTTGSVDLKTYSQEMKTPTTYRYSIEGQYLLSREWVATVGYQGSQSRHYSRQRNLNWHYPEHRNPAISRVWYYSNDGNAYYNALLAEVKHRFSYTFEFNAQYRWTDTEDTGSNEYYIGEYPFDLAYLRGPADFDVRHNLKFFGIWSPRLFQEGWKEKVLGGWQVSGIVNWHTGFPWTPIYNGTSCNVIYPGSGFCNLMPGSYTGGAGSNYDNETFQRTNGNFPGGAYQYFTVPVYSSDNTIPPPPGVERNSFRGPRYFAADMSLQKSFGLPKLKVLGETAKLVIKADLFNLLNNLNLNNANNVIGSNPNTPNPLFGQSQGALAGRVVNLQARFSF